MMPFFNFNIALLPWLSTENGTTLTYTGLKRLPADDKKYATIKLQFIEGATHTPDNYLRLFIDEESGLLKGVEYNSTYAPMLDAMGIKGKEFGPGFHVYTSYKTIDKRVFPERYKTYIKGKLAGVHALSGISLTQPFNEELAHREGSLMQVTAHPTQRMLIEDSE